MRAHPDLPDMWQGSFIPYMEKTYSYYFKAVDDPESVKLPSSQEGREQLELLFEALALDSIFVEWYDDNLGAIRAGIRRMAE